MGPFRYVVSKTIIYFMYILPYQYLIPLSIFQNSRDSKLENSRLISTNLHSFRRKVFKFTAKMSGLVAKLPPIVMAYTKPLFATFVKYGKTKLTPPSPMELPAAVAQAVGLATKAITFQWAGLTVKQVWLNTLVAAEVGCWFFIGECIGKGSLVAYKVNGPGEHHAAH